jgi:thymidylate synthase
MTHPEQQYLNLLKTIIETGDERMDRTGTGTIALFGQQMRFNLADGFPAITTKKLAWKAIVSELLWFIEGSGDEKRLKEILHGDRNSEKQTIWTGNAEAPYWKPKAKFEGDLGRIYGVNWRDWKRYVQISPGGSPMEHDARYVEGEPVDQLMQLIDGLKKDPFGRRHVLTAWNPGELDQMSLPPCHMFAQFFVSNLKIQERIDLARKLGGKISIADGCDINKHADKIHDTIDDLALMQNVFVPRRKLSCQMYQRSMDTFLGCPFNIASYSLFTHMIAQVCGMGVGEFIHIAGDAHVYSNHVDQVKEQLTRTPLPLPTLWLNHQVKDITKFTMDDIKLIGYQSHDAIKAPMAV